MCDMKYLPFVLSTLAIPGHMYIIRLGWNSFPGEFLCNFCQQLFFLASIYDGNTIYYHTFVKAFIVVNFVSNTQAIEIELSDQGWWLTFPRYLKNQCYLDRPMFQAFFDDNDRRLGISVFDVVCHTLASLGGLGYEKL